jgi:ricin-type beta-trefoil lectin protein
MEFKGMLRRIAGAGVALAAVGAMLIAPVSASAAPTPQLKARGTIVNILHASSRNCLSANANGQVGLAECNGLNQQKWDNFTSGGVGRYRNVAFNACLTSDGAQVSIVSDCDTLWSGWTSTSGSPKYIKHAVETAKCLHTNSGSAGKFAYLITCNEATRWSVLPTS